MGERQQEREMDGVAQFPRTSHKRAVLVWCWEEIFRAKTGEKEQENRPRNPQKCGRVNKEKGQHRTIAEASAVESPIRQETIGFPAHFFARAHNFKPPGRACQPEADSPMRT